MFGTLFLWMAVLHHPGAETAEPLAVLRCNRTLISEGDRTYRVRKLCGTPTLAERRVEQRSFPGCGGPSCWTSVVVDHWVYDFGPRQFVRHLTFEDTVLIHVEAGDWGH